MPNKADIMAHLEPAEREELERLLTEAHSLHAQAAKIRTNAEIRGGLSHRDIGKNLGISRQAVKKIESLAMHKLRFRLKELNQELK